MAGDKNLIGVNELKQRIESDSNDIVVFDASYALPGTDPSPLEVYRQSRIPGALFFDIDRIADQKSDLPHMLCTAGEFSTHMQKLGVDNSKDIIVYGQKSPAMGPARAWWMFKIFGHDNVRILDGGLPAWQEERFYLESDPPPVKTGEQFYQADYIPALHCTAQDIKSSLSAPGTVILDARPAARFKGEADEPRPGLRRGHIPGSLNVPASDLLHQDGTLLDQDDLVRIFKAKDPDIFEKTVILTCGSGVTACFLAFALNLCGHKDIKVYDGSWAEWGKVANSSDQNAALAQ